jgi:hypothetical protein
MQKVHLSSNDIYFDSTLVRFLKRVEFFNVFLMFVLTLTDGLCCASFVYPIMCWCWCPETGTGSIDWAQLSKFHLKTEIESSLRNIVF